MKYIQPCEHKPFVLKTFNLCEKCGEALHHMDNAPLGYRSNYIQFSERGDYWKKDIKEAKRDRGRYRRFHQWRRTHEKFYYFELGFWAGIASLALLIFLATR